MRQDKVSQLSALNETFVPYHHQPHLKLLCSFLQRAVLDFLGYGDTSTAKYKFEREARLWVGSASTEPFSYLWTCSELEIDPNRLCARLHQIKGRKEGRFEVASLIRHAI